jgi:very-short-patch-repair endonuclease
MRKDMCGPLAYNEGMSHKLTEEEILTRFIEVHGNLYDYSKMDYTNSKTKIEILCSKHGSFFQAPESHWKLRQGCPVCAGNLPLGLERFIQKASEVHTQTYTYQNVTYLNNSTKVEITCQAHGNFWQRPLDHLNGNGCPRCNSPEVDTQVFVIKAREIHGNRYDYTRTAYIRSADKLTIGCKVHGDFQMLPGNHITSKQGCPRCKASKGELEVLAFLEREGLEFQTQAKFAGCRNPKTNRKLRLDFYIPSLNLAIEFDGKQHREACDRFGGSEELLQIQYRDSVKTKFCEKAGIHLLRIQDVSEVDSCLRAKLGVILH